MKRHAFLACGAAAAVLVPRAAGAADDAPAALARLERAGGGRLGVAALDTGSGATAGHRELERFPMCSTFKVALAAAILQRADAGTETLAKRITYGQSDLLSWAPVTRAHLAEGGMTVDALCAAAIEHSDNTAANLLLARIGGPAALTRFVRTLGDTTTRFDRSEPALNTAIPGDERDTTTPSAMVALLQRLLLANDVLSAASRERLEGWLAANTTGGARLRAGFPADWRVGDKTGSGDHGATNDVAIVRPPGRAPFLIVVFSVDSTAPEERRSATIAEAGRIVAGVFVRGG